MERKAKKTTPSNLIYGRHPILEALQQGLHFDKLFLLRGAQGESIGDIKRLAIEQDIVTQYVPVEKLNRLTRKNHQGVVGFSALIPYYSVEDVLAQAYDSGHAPLFLICDGITDVGNFGAIARSAACTGVHGIIIPRKGAASISAEALKASAGALHQIPVCKVRYLDHAIKYLQSLGLQVVASTLQNAIPLKTVDLTVPTALIIGAEGKGVSPKFAKMADVCTNIPMIGKFDSFNVSVAAGILLYESVRQRT